MPSKNYKLVVKDMGMNEIIKKTKQLNGVKIKVGLFGSGDPRSNVAARGAVHEYGSTKRNIPIRPFTAQAFDMNLKILTKFINKLLTKLYFKNLPTTAFLKKIAVLHEGQIKKSIVSRLFWPLKPATIKRKKSSVQLVDTGIMLNSVKNKIGKGT